jgi:hypothetical protein
MTARRVQEALNEAMVTLRTLSRVLADTWSDPSPSDPPASSESTPSTSMPSTPEPLIDRLLMAMEANQARWMELLERQARESREAMITLVQGRPTMGQPYPAEVLTYGDLPPGPATGPGQVPLSMPTYDSDEIPLAPGIDSVLAREQMESEAERQRLLRTEPDVLQWQLEQRRQAMGLDPTGPPVPPGSPI